MPARFALARVFGALGGNQFLRILAVSCLTTLIAGASSATSEPGHSSAPELSHVTATGFEDNPWSVEQYHDGAGLVRAIAASRMTFTNGRIDGTPGCGFLFASYKLTGTRLTITSFGLIVSGYCADDALPQSKGIAKALSGEFTIEQDGERIALRDAHGIVQVILRS